MFKNNIKLKHLRLFVVLCNGENPVPGYPRWKSDSYYRIYNLLLIEPRSSTCTTVVFQLLSPPTSEVVDRSMIESLKQNIDLEPKISIIVDTE